MNNLRRISILFCTLLVSQNSIALSEKELNKIYEQSTFSCVPKPQPTIHKSDYDPGIFSGSIDFPASSKELSIRMYYKGQIVPIENGTFTLEDDKNLKKFDIVVGLLAPPTSNTLSYLEIPENIPYKLSPSLEENTAVAVKAWHLGTYLQNNIMTDFL